VSALSPPTTFRKAARGLDGGAKLVDRIEIPLARGRVVWVTGYGRPGATAWIRLPKRIRRQDLGRAVAFNAYWAEGLTFEEASRRAGKPGAS